VLLHEAWATEGAPEQTPIHSSGRDAARVAIEAGSERLMLIHLHPLTGHDAVLDEARSRFAAAELARDGLEIEL
jgi:ribonuclease BN (tRNA processing enzyme)